MFILWEMKGMIAGVGELDALLRLLDDETPEVRAGVEERIGELGGDVSELLPCLERPLSEREMRVLLCLLKVGRRKVLKEEWQMPVYGVGALEEDWEMFESQMRMLSDFLHDGVTLRQPLSDALDLLADEFSEMFPDAYNEEDLRRYLFEEGRMKGNREGYHDTRNGDLAWSIAEGVSNPIGLGIIFMLVARRLGLVVEGICYPGHFLCRIYEDGRPFVVDCFDEGRVYDEEVLAGPEHSMNSEQRMKLRSKADLGMILMRVMNNLVNAFRRAGEDEDAELLTEIREAMMERRF